MQDLIKMLSWKSEDLQRQTLYANKIGMSYGLLKLNVIAEI